MLTVYASNFAVKVWLEYDVLRRLYRYSFVCSCLGGSQSKTWEIQIRSLNTTLLKQKVHVSKAKCRHCQNKIQIIVDLQGLRTANPASYIGTSLYKSQPFPKTPPIIQCYLCGSGINASSPPIYYLTPSGVKYRICSICDSLQQPYLKRQRYGYAYGGNIKYKSYFDRVSFDDAWPSTYAEKRNKNKEILFRKWNLIFYAELMLPIRSTANNFVTCPCCDARHKITELKALACECGAKEVFDDIPESELTYAALNDMMDAFKASLRQPIPAGAGMPRYSRTREAQKASFIWDGLAGVYKLHFDFSKEFIDLIKATIPSSHRSYDPGSKTWIIDEHFYDPILAMLKAKFTNVHTVSKQEVEERQKEYQVVTTVTDTDKELKIFTDLLKEAGISFDVHEKDGAKALKAYRRAALFYHPDRNPEKAKDMSSLNAAFQNLKKHFGLEQRNG
jgi:hypothetical protein